jgi:flagellar biosynthesis protein FlhA
LGFVMPSVRVRDNVRLRPLQYQIKIRGETVAQAEAQPRLLLAMPPSADSPPIEGMATTEPVFGMRAYWIEPSLREQAQRLGYTVVEPTAVVATHLTEIVRRYAAELLGRAETQQLLDNLKEHNAVVVQEVVPDLLTLGEVQKALQHLLREGVPIRDLETILETLGDHAGARATRKRWASTRAPRCRARSRTACCRPTANCA